MIQHPQIDWGKIAQLLHVDSAGGLSMDHQQGDFGCAKTLDIVHALLHDGKMYSHSNIHAVIAPGSEHLHILRVDSGRAPHFVIPYISSALNPMELRIYENVQVSSYDGVTTVFNHNRAMPSSSWITMFENAVVSSVGTELSARALYGTGNQGSSDAQFESDEWVLMGGKTYAIGVKNGANQATAYSIVTKWVQP